MTPIKHTKALRLRYSRFFNFFNVNPFRALPLLIYIDAWIYFSIKRKSPSVLLLGAQWGVHCQRSPYQVLIWESNVELPGKCYPISAEARDKESNKQKCALERSRPLHASLHFEKPTPMYSGAAWQSFCFIRLANGAKNWSKKRLRAGDV